MPLGMQPCTATQEVDAMLAADAVMEEMSPGTQSCTVDMWPSVACTPEWQQSPATRQTPAMRTFSSSGCWEQRAQSSNDAAHSDARRGDASWEAELVGQAGCALAPPSSVGAGSSAPEGDASVGLGFAEAAAARASLRRVRLRGKQAPPAWADAPLQIRDVLGDTAREMAWVKPPTREPLLPVKAYFAVYDCLRKAFSKFQATNGQCSGVKGTKIGRELRTNARRSYSQLNMSERLGLAQRTEAAGLVPQELAADFTAYSTNLEVRLRRCARTAFLERTPDVKGEVRGPYVMLTYSLTEKCNLHGYPVPVAGTPLAHVVAALLQVCAVQALCEETKCFVQQMMQGLAVHRHAWSLEVCPRTWQMYTKVKLHLHVAAVKAEKFKWRLADIQWGSAVPFGGRACPGAREKKGAGPASVMFYCQIPKIGQLLCGGSHEPFHDYHINPEWITNLVQAEKITMNTARELYVRSAKNVVHHLQNLDRLQEEVQKRALQSHVHAVQAACSTQLRSFHDVHVVTYQWKPLYTAIRPRYPFLVLCGPSGTGKTSYAKHITGDPQEVLEVNCAACPEPDLRDFRYGLHKAILFDEANPSLVLAQRRLFQAPPCLVDLGCSTTNCHKYQVFVSGVMMVICSNTWREQVAKIPNEGDAQWLTSNSVVVDVHQVLWRAL